MQDRTQIKIQKIHKLNAEKANNTNKTTLVQSPFMTLGQETKWAYSTTLPSPYGAVSRFYRGL